MVGEGCGRCCLTEGVGASHDGSDRAAVHLGPAEAANQIIVLSLTQFKSISQVEISAN